MKELKEITNEVVKQSEELLEHLEETLEIDEEIRQELVELKMQHHKMNKIMLSVGSMTALYSLLIIIKSILIVVQ